MAKKSKMFKGAAVSEAINEEAKAPIDEAHISAIEPEPEPPAVVEEEIFLEPEEVDIPIYVAALKHNKKFRALAAKQFTAGTVKEKGSVLLPDGQIIKAGATLKTIMKPGLKKMLYDGVLLAGKAPRKEKGVRKAL